MGPVKNKLRPFRDGSAFNAAQSKTVAAFIEDMDGGGDTSSASGGCELKRVFNWYCFVI